MRFRVERELGRGAMGVVYLAQDELLGRLVALKVPPPALQNDANARSTLLREARAVAALSHPNILALYEIGEDELQCFLCLEYVDGMTVKEILSERGHLSIPVAVEVGIQVASGLECAHHKHMVHRDIKPSNIILTPVPDPPKKGEMPQEFLAKILDFGLARSVEAVATTSTAFAGTPFYMSPEQIRGAPVTAATDVYGLGITLFEMLTGTVPFRSGDIYGAHLREPAPAPSDYVPVLPRALDPIVQKCMAKAPEDRYVSMSSLIEDLRSLDVSSL